MGNVRVLEKPVLAKPRTILEAINAVQRDLLDYTEINRRPSLVENAQYRLGILLELHETPSRARHWQSVVKGFHAQQWSAPTNYVSNAR